MGLGLALAVAALMVPSDTLRMTMVGNAGVLLTDGSTSLLVDLPYQSGAFGYDSYRPDALDPPGDVVSVITHHHLDHFDPDLFEARAAWRVVGPESVTRSLPQERVIPGDSIRLGEFDVVVLPTPHTADHRSYRIRWRNRLLHFVGDTESPDELIAGPRSDVLFITPWLACTAAERGHVDLAELTLGYHLQRRGRDRICGEVEVLPQGASVFVVEAISD